MGSIWTFSVCFLVFLQCFLVSSVNGEHYSEDNLPPLFDKEDYYTCQNQKGTYCKVDLHLEVHNETSKLAEEIKRSLNDKYRFKLSALHRMVCVPKEITSSNTTEQYIIHLSEEKLKNFNVTVNVENLECNEDRHFQLYDILIVGFYVGYALMIFESTRYDVSRDNPKTPASKYDKWFKIFSLRQNWKKATDKNTNFDFQNLKSLQGLRFFNTILIITCHTKMCHLLLFIENPKDYEESLSHPIHRISNQLDMFIVQTYFMTSSFLLANQVLDLYKKTGKFTLGNCLNLYINRIIRLWPTSALMVLLTLFGMKIYPKGTPVVNVINMCWKGCIKTWWGTMFQLNFFYDSTQMCNPISWYLSVDCLLYASTLFLLYIHLTYKINLRRLLTITFVVLSVNYGLIIYAHDMDAVFKTSAESIRTIIESPSFYQLYVNPFSNWSTSIIGIALGYVYFNIKHKDVHLNKIQQNIVMFLFFALPSIALYLCFLDLKGINRALLGPFLKPLFALGFGIGVLGMSKGYGGMTKKILEWDFAVKMSNFTYCTYVYHFLIVFLLHGSRRSLYRFSVFYLIFSCIQDVVLSYAIGGIMSLGVEYPGLTLQKMYVPQIKKTPKEVTHKK